MIWLLVSVAVLVLGTGVAWVLLGPLARRATRPYITATTSPTDDLESLTKIRSTLLQAAQGVVVVGGVLFTAGTLLYTASSVRLAQQTLDSTRDGQVTNRYTAAIEDLGSSNAEVRIGGMYALQRIAEDSPHDKPTVVRVLAAFVRNHGIAGSAAVQDDENTAVEILMAEATADDPANLRGAQLPHLQQSGADMRALDLSGANLQGAYLAFANLAGAQLSGADLSGAHLKGADLHGAQLSAADLHGADLHGAHLNGANLAFANLADAELRAADLHDADLNSANLKGASLSGANLAGADLSRAKLAGALLAVANLAGADLSDADLYGADLRRAIMPDGTKHP
ncbi:pentapeptide repeat-containing protein [Streptomyces sp. JNUCC 63]